MFDTYFGSHAGKGPARCAVGFSFTRRLPTLVHTTCSYIPPWKHVTSEQPEHLVQALKLQVTSVAMRVTLGLVLTSTFPLAREVQYFGIQFLQGLCSYY